MCALIIVYHICVEFCCSFCKSKEETKGPLINKILSVLFRNVLVPKRSNFTTFSISNLSNTIIKSAIIFNLSRDIEFRRGRDFLEYREGWGYFLVCF
jgi:hypothetical protein